MRNVWRKASEKSEKKVPVQLFNKELWSFENQIGVSKMGYCQMIVLMEKHSGFGGTPFSSSGTFFFRQVKANWCRHVIFEPAA